MKKRLQLKESKNVLYWFSLILGTMLLLMIAVKFIFSDIEIPPQITIAYPVMLTAYVAVKEAVRWVKEKTSVRLGEIMVALWWGMLILMFVAQYILRWLGFDQGRFTIPGEILTTCIEVLVIYTASEISKKIFSKKNGENQSSG